MALRDQIANVDATDGDWIKRGTWDIPAANAEELLEWLYDQRMTVEHFKTLDAYRANVDELPWLADL